jgi:uncharacterized protein
MAASKSPAAPIEKWGRLPRGATLLERRLDALAEFCDPMGPSELDGFLAGIAVSPEQVSFADWLPVILYLAPDDKVEAILGPDEAKSIADMLLERFDAVRDEIISGRFLPIIDIDTRTGEEIWYLWINGFSLAMELRPRGWDTFAVGSEATRYALKGLKRLIAIDRGTDGLPDDFLTVMTNLAPTLIPVWVSMLMAYRLSGDTSDYPDLPPLKLTASPGRNDPCPCGSGKKYKKCCYAQ